METGDWGAELVRFNRLMNMTGFGFDVAPPCDVELKLP